MDSAPARLTIPQPGTETIMVGADSISALNIAKINYNFLR